MENGIQLSPTQIKIDNVKAGGIEKFTLVSDAILFTLKCSNQSSRDYNHYYIVRSMGMFCVCMEEGVEDVLGMALYSRIEYRVQSGMIQKAFHSSSFQPSTMEHLTDISFREIAEN